MLNSRLIKTFGDYIAFLTEMVLDWINLLNASRTISSRCRRSDHPMFY